MQASFENSDSLEEDWKNDEDMNNFIAEICSPDFISRLIGMFEQNNVGINTLCYERNKPEIDTDEMNHLWDVLESLYEVEDCCGSEEEREHEEIEEGNLYKLGQKRNNENESLCNAIDESDEETEEEEEEEETKTDVKAREKKYESGNVTLIGSKEDQVNSGDVPVEESETDSHLFEQESDGKIILDGTALYSYICCMNHSCDPNVMVLYYPPSYVDKSLHKSNPLEEYAKTPEDKIQSTRPLVATVIAIKDIQSGEELLHSYVDRYMLKEERQAALVDYGFKCECSKCLLEEENPTLTMEKMEE